MTSHWEARYGSPAVATSPGPRSGTWAELTRSVVRDRANRGVFAFTFVVIGFGYSLLLPYAFTQRISFANWGYLDARYVAFTIAFALGLGWLITLQIHAARRLARSAAGAQGTGRAGPVGVLAAVVSVLPSLLCCSPILPTLVGLIGLSATARLSTTVQLQHLFATRENLLLFGALGLLLLSGLWSMRKLARAACLDGDCCAPPLADGRERSDPVARAPQQPMHPAGVRAGGEE